MQTVVHVPKKKKVENALRGQMKSSGGGGRLSKGGGDTEAFSKGHNHFLDGQIAPSAPT